MARKQFVSSKKNAPSRAVPSKEAALHGRDPKTLDDDDDEDDDDDVRSENDDGSMNGGADSPVSSVPSSPISSDVDDDDDDEGDEKGRDRVDEKDDDDPADDRDDGDDGGPVAVEVLPASVGRGKQLRFPIVSRGKEARMLHNSSDRDGSDSESYASVASDEEDGDGDDDVEMQAAGASAGSPSKVPTATENDNDEEENDDTVYPIKAFRARKRHRPDAGYSAHMSTHVRDCLLSIRDMGTADALSEEAHHEFRRKLSAGTVERVLWKQASPPPPAQAPSDSEKKVPKSSPRRDGSDRKRAREEKDKETGRSSSSTSKSSSRKSGEERSDRKPEKSSRSADDKDVAKKERSGKENDSSGSTRRDDKELSSSKSDSADKSSKTSKLSKRAEENGHGANATDKKIKCEDVLCAKCKKSVSEQNADEAKRKAAVEAAAAAADLQAKAAQAALDAAAAQRARIPAPAASTSQPVPTGTFIMPTSANANRDIAQLREESTRLNEEARSLKHEGNRRGKADPGAEGQAAQVRYYLRSSAKFFQHALLLADIKAAYREAGNERQARTYGDFCIQTLTQTSSLIESTVRISRAAKNNRLIALAYKLTSIVELTIHRLQHIRLFSMYSNLYPPGRSPDSRSNGTTPPTNDAATDTQDNAAKAQLLKKLEHTLRGFEMWQQYELRRVEVLPRITNPAVVDLDVLFEDLATELGQS